MSYDKTKPKRCTDEFANLLRDMVDKMLAAKHETVWLGTESRDALIYMTINAETAKKARDVLSKAGKLCDLDLGSYGPVQVTEDKPDAEADGASKHEGCPHGSYDLIARCARCKHEQPIDLKRKDSADEIEVIHESARRTVAAHHAEVRDREKRIVELMEVVTDKDELLDKWKGTVVDLRRVVGHRNATLETWRSLVAAAIEMGEAIRTVVDTGKLSFDASRGLGGSYVVPERTWCKIGDVARIAHELGEPPPKDDKPAETNRRFRAISVEEQRDAAWRECHRAEKRRDAWKKSFEDSQIRVVDLKKQVSDLRGAVRAVEQLADYHEKSCERMSEEISRLLIENDRLHVELTDRARATLPEPDPLGSAQWRCGAAHPNPEKDK